MRIPLVFGKRAIVSSRPRANFGKLVAEETEKVGQVILAAKSNQKRFFAGCCTCAARGYAAAPPIRWRNSRRRI
jgi:hypothetical protein